MNLPALLPIIGVLVTLFSVFLAKKWLAKACIFLLSLLLASAYYGATTKLELIDQKRVYEQTKADSERWKETAGKLAEQLKVQGVNTNAKLRGVDDFKKDWDWSNFFLVGTDTFCPRIKGGNHYQRMRYKYDTPFAGSDLNLKFQMIDDSKVAPEYGQRVVVGTTLDGSVFSEFDIPTRDEQIINFRVASESGDLIPGGLGKSLGSPIIENSVINLNLRTKSKNGQNMTEILTLDYISKYGDEHKGVDYDAETGDSRPETTRTNLVIGSYIGACIKIIGWGAN